MYFAIQQKMSTSITRLDAIVDAAKVIQSYLYVWPKIDKCGCSTKQIVRSLLFEFIHYAAIFILCPVASDCSLQYVHHIVHVV